MNATIEICTNNEFIRDSILDPDAFDSELWGDEAAREWHGEFCQRLELAGFNTRNAQGQRVLLHGWNGANTWANSGSGWGTFDELTEGEVDQIIALCDEAVETVQANPAWQPNDSE